MVFLLPCQRYAEISPAFFRNYTPSTQRSKTHRRKRELSGDEAQMFRRVSSDDAALSGSRQPPDFGEVI
jgi:hypothetical protein